MELRRKARGRVAQPRGAGESDAFNLRAGACPCRREPASSRRRRRTAARRLQASAHGPWSRKQRPRPSHDMESSDGHDPVRASVWDPSDAVRDVSSSPARRLKRSTAFERNLCDASSEGDLRSQLHLRRNHLASCLSLSPPLARRDRQGRAKVLALQHSVCNPKHLLLGGTEEERAKLRGAALRHGEKSATGISCGGSWRCSGGVASFSDRAAQELAGGVFGRASLLSYSGVHHDPTRICRPLRRSRRRRRGWTGSSERASQGSRAERRWSKVFNCPESRGVARLTRRFLF